MGFEDIYFTLEKVLEEGAISIPIMPNFNLDNLVEGSFYLSLPSRPKQEVVKGLVRQYLLGQKAKGKDVMLIVLMPDAEKGIYDSPVAVKTDRMFYDDFPEIIDSAIIYCMERHVFDSLYGKTLVREKNPAFC